MTIKITVFTPAYNRAHTLNRCYQSLLQQENIEQLEWILINDGSTDHTDDVVNSLIAEGKIKINYIKQDNQGKQAAWNKAVLLAQGMFFVGLDSDDTLQPFSLFKILNHHISELEKNNIIGIRCLAVSNITQQPSGKAISNYDITCSWFDEFSDGRNFGERIDILKTDVIKQFLYPVNQHIKFIPEIWFYVNVAYSGYLFIYSPQALSLFFDDEMDNRLSKSSILKNAEGHYISRGAMLKLIPLKVWRTNPLALFKSIIRFSQVCKFLEKPFQERKKTVNLFFAIFSYIISLLC